MQPFAYLRPTSEENALAAGAGSDARYIAGGTTLVDLMKIDVMQPATLVDINALALARIEPLGDGVRIGALVKNSDLAEHPLIAQRFPVLAEALLSGASPQLRNMASV